MSTTYHPVPGDFEPAEATQSLHQLSRPSLSYWQDAWRRLKTNNRAVISLWVIVALMLFTVAGPWIWRVDPAFQDIKRSSQPPLAFETARLSVRSDIWPGVTLTDHPAGPPEDWYDQLQDPLPAPTSFSVSGTPSTYSVRLRWAPVDNATGYLVYRNIYRPTTLNELGLPVGETLAGNEVGYEDRLGLEAGTYYYSILATDGVQESPLFRILEVTVEQAIDIESARSRGLLGPDDPASPGDVLHLPVHPLGTDYLGRDMLARLMYGARTSLFIGITAPLVYILFGAIFGAIAGYLGGRWDALLMRFADFVVALPFLLFMILFRIASGVQSGESSITPMLIALIILLWPATARLVRGQVLQIREDGYVQAARLLGAGGGYLVLRHMIPNTMGVILVSLTFAIPTAIFIEAFLSFIGMGVAPPTPSWGSMSFEGLKTILTSPHELIFPSLFISITVLAFNLLGDGLRDALDARLRGTSE